MINVSVFFFIFETLESIASFHHSYQHHLGDKGCEYIVIFPLKLRLTNATQICNMFKVPVTLLLLSPRDVILMFLRSKCANLDLKKVCVHDRLHLHYESDPLVSVQQ